jgi:exopolysaccharide biosynthesis polyprenyl glycosylphosphotransferase
LAGPLRRRGWLVRRALLAADICGLLLAFLLAEIAIGFGTGGGPSDRLGAVIEVLLFVATIPGWIAVARLYHLYDRDEKRTNHGTTDDLVGVLHVITVGAWLFLVGAWLTRLAQPPFTKVVWFWAFAILFVTLARTLARAFCRRHSSYRQNTIIVGAGEVGQLVAHKILHHPEYGINLLGFVDSAPKQRRDDLGEVMLLGDPAELPTIVEGLDVERVIVAFSGDPHDETLELVRSLKDHWIQIDIVPRLFEIVGPSADIYTVEGLPLVGLPPFRLSRTSRILKRAFDSCVSLTLLALTSPLFAATALAIKLTSPGPIFFRQVRMGTTDEVFRIYKFRTMAADAEERKAELSHLNKHARKDGDPRMFKIRDDPRVTPVGRVLRRHLIDELPQLINVLKGEMSLVGPRPLILDEDRHVDGWARRRLDLKPGMTGLWQVLGRSDIPFDEMVKLDYLYVTTWSLWGDVCLIFRTLPIMIAGEGAEFSHQNPAVAVERAGPAAT